MKKLLNDGWEYLKLPAGSGRNDLEGKSWNPTDLPHDWLIWQSDRDLYESADVWYRKRLSFPGNLPEVCLLHFDGVYMDCDVLLNGEIVRSHAYGYTAFYAELTGRLRPGENEILVHIRHQSPNSRWYSGSGIFRDVTLITLPADHIVPDSFRITERQEGENWEITIHAEATGTDSGLFECAVTDPDGKEAARSETIAKDGKICIRMTLQNARKWDLTDPAIYILRYTYGQETGKIRFGLRSVEYTTDHGFLLNGRHVKLKGVCLHHDLGALGAAFHEKAARRQLLLMKRMGANAVRTSHNPPASRFLDLCDEMGILVIDEAFDMWERPKTTYDYARFFPEHEAEDVALWIRRDRCHPSVILWSIGNEIYDMHADLRGTEVCRMLTEQVRSHDPDGHAAVTFGCNYMPWEGGQRCADIVKIAGYNYGEKCYAEHHRNHPDWTIYGSETASVLSSRGIYHFPIEKSIMSEADLQCSALGNSNTSWGAADLRKMIIDDLQCEYSMGQFIWSGIDYIGEPTPYHTRSCYFGQADTACFPKDPYYLFQSLWSDAPVLHIGVHWDWNPGQRIDVPIMTNYDRVELMVNHRSLGIREVSREDPERCLPVWKVPFEAGELRVRALDSEGNVLREDFRKTPGETARLTVTAEESFLRSDGKDLAFLTVQAEDADGYPVDNARDRVCITVSGGAVLAGTDNGDSTDPDGYKQACRRLFGGKLLLILASNGVKKDAVVRMESTSGLCTETRLHVQECECTEDAGRMQGIPEGNADGIIPLRKIEITAEGSRTLNRERNTCVFRWAVKPANATLKKLIWQITNDGGIETPFADAAETGDHQITVTVRGDGVFYLRALGSSSADHPEVISQIELAAEGIGRPALNPYEFISAGLYDLHDGEIGTGNEKGIAFARDGASMAGFSRIDFGKAGSDTLTIPVFALDDKPYEIELLDGDPREGGRVLSVLHYEKPSIWNQYQEETYHLPERLTGIHTLCFRMNQKVHLKGFSFEQQSRAFVLQSAGDADIVYGDSFVRDGSTIREIGNNVSLRFGEMDFGTLKECVLEIHGKTDLAVNAITVRIDGENGENRTEIANFLGTKEACQRFPVHVPGGMCTVTFVFLPGSHFDFEAFRFDKIRNKE